MNLYKRFQYIIHWNQIQFFIHHLLYPTTMKPTHFLVLLIFWLSSCAQSQQDNAQVAFEVDMPPTAQKAQAAPPEPSQATDVQLPTERKIIKQGTITFETKDAEATGQRIAKAVADYNGYITEDEQSDYDYRVEHRVTIRIPAGSFDALLDAIAKGADDLKSKNISAQDVTEEYVDVESRIKTKKELEARYQQLLQKATKVEEMLAIEREMGTLRTEIESIEGRLRYLKDRVAFSTLTVIYYETPSASFGFFGKIGFALRDGWNNLLEFLVGVVSLWPFVLLATGLFLLLRRYLKSRRKVV